MKKYFLSVLLLTAVLILAGCQYVPYGLPEEPIVFKSGEFYPDNDDSGYRTVEYDDKVYIMYGGIKAIGLLRDISYACGVCLGYVEDDESERIYALVNESTDEWLIEYYVGGIMEQPIVLREISAKDNDRIPGSVEAFDYEYWK